MFFYLSAQAREEDAIFMNNKKTGLSGQSVRWFMGGHESELEKNVELGLSPIIFGGEEKSTALLEKYERIAKFP